MYTLAYLQPADRIPHRTGGEATLLEEVPNDAAHILVLGSSDGRVLGPLLLARPAAGGVAGGFSPPMLKQLREPVHPLPPSALSPPHRTEYGSPSVSSTALAKWWWKRAGSKVWIGMTTLGSRSPTSLIRSAR